MIAHKKPPVTFNILGSGVNYVCLKDENGIEVENRNVEKYAEAIQILSQNEELRVLYGKNSEKRVKENFLFSNFKEKIRDVVR